MKSPLLATQLNPGSVDVVLLLMRIVVGALFIIVGYPKIQAPMSWMPGAGIPGFFQLLAAIAEFIGGMALIAGFLTRIAAFGLACTMAVSIYFMKFRFGATFIDMKGGSNVYNLNLILFLISLLFMVISAGRFSLDRLLFGVRLKVNTML
jgi:putative oxidoreductase